MIDIMRTVHGAYAPASEPFGTRLETFFIGLCVAIGNIDGKPFSVAKIAAYMRVPRTTVIRRLAQLQSWGLIDRRLVETAHEAGARVIAWTVNSREVAEELVRLGVDGICTDDLRQLSS